MLCGSEQEATGAAEAERSVSKLPQGADFMGEPQMGHISSNWQISIDSD